EATHVVQQQSGMAQRMVQRDETTPAAGSTSAVAPASGPATGVYDSSQGSIRFPSLAIPNDLDYLARYRAKAPLIDHKDFTGNRSNTQRSDWVDGVNKTESVNVLCEVFRESPGNS